MNTYRAHNKLSSISKHSSSFVWKKWPVIFIVAMFLFSSTRSAMAAPVVLDDFSQIPDANILNVTLATSPQTATVDDASILGTERDLQSIVTLGAGTMSVNAADTSGYLTHSQPTGLRGRTIITWDGDDSNASSLAATGLGGVNLQSPTNDAFLIGVVSTDVASQMTIQVFTDATNHSTASAIAVGAGLSNSTLVVLFSGFTVTGGTGADFTNVGAVQITVNSAASPAPALDIVIDFVTAGESGSYRDFGDLPDTYGTLLASDGARHTASNLFLGSTFDSEGDGVPSGGATGDGTDEDGVSRVGTWTNGVNGGQVSVTVTGDSTACLSGWMDFNNNGDFADAGEQILDLVTVNSGANSVSFDIPAGTFTGGGPNLIFNARFRLVTDATSDSLCLSQTNGGDEPDLTSTGAYLNGEVEDFQWTFSPTAITLTNLTATPGSNAALVGAAGLVLLGTAFLLFRRSRKHAYATVQED